MLLEPASSVTDFALGVLAIGAALMVERKERVNHHWRFAFLFMGVAAILGGVHHGFIGPGGPSGAVSWAAIILSVAVAISFLLSATIASVLGEGRGRPLLIIRGVSSFAFFILVILGRATITTLLITEGLAMTMVVLLWLYAWRLEQPGVALVLAAIGASVLAAAVRGSSVHVTLGWEFDPNALYHLEPDGKAPIEQPQAPVASGHRADVARQRLDVRLPAAIGGLPRERGQDIGRLVGGSVID